MADWIRLDVGAADHPKVRHLGRLLGLDRRGRLGAISLFWSAVRQHSCDGDVTGWHPEDFAEAVGYPSNDGALVHEALLKSGLVEISGDLVIVHDWPDYQGQLRDAERKRLQRARGRGRKPVTPASVTPSRPRPSRAPARPDQTNKTRQDQQVLLGRSGVGSDVGDVATSETPLADRSADRAPESSAKNGRHPDGFETWYRTLYPRRVKPDLAERAYRAALRRGHTVAEIHDGTRSWAEHWERAVTEMQHIPYPASFLNGGQFRDPPPESGVLNLEDPL